MDTQQKEIRVIDLAKVVPWKLVKKAMEFMHPTHGKRGEKVYTKLLKQIAEYPRTRTQKEKWYLKLHATPKRFLLYPADNLREYYKLPECLEEDYISCSQIKEGNDEHWGLSFQPWKKLSNLIVEEETLNRYTAAMILAEFMWEITWYGPEKKSMKIGKSIMKRAKQVEKNPEKYTKPFDNGDK